MIIRDDTYIMVAGLPVWWGSVPAEEVDPIGSADTKIPGYTVANYVQRVEKISDLSQDYAEGPFTTISNITASFSSDFYKTGFDPLSVEGQKDPGVLLLRGGLKQATWFGNLTETVEYDATTIKIDRPYAGPSLPHVCHMGVEAFTVTAAAGSSPDPIDGDPYRLTVTRGVLGTVAQRHLYSPISGDVPVVVDRVVHWAGRRVYIFKRIPSASANPVFSGVLDRGGEMKGGMVYLEVLPLTTLLEQGVSGVSSEAYLAPNAHYFGREMRWEYIAAMVDRALLDADSTSNTDETDLFVTVGPRVAGAPEIVPIYSELVDVTRPLGCPRRGGFGALGSGGSGAFHTLYPTGFVGDDTINVYDDGETWNSWSQPFSQRAAEVKSYAFGPGLVEDWVGTFQNALTDSPDSVAGDDGNWFRPNMLVQDDGSVLMQMETVTGILSFFAPPQIWFFGEEAALRRADEVYFSGDGSIRRYVNGRLRFVTGVEDQLWFPCDFATPDDNRWMNPSEPDRVAYSRGWWINKTTLPQGNLGGTRGVIPVRGFASAFYQVGEEYILIDRPLFLNPNGATVVEVDTYSRERRERVKHLLIVDEQTAEGSYYKLRVVVNTFTDRSFGDFLENDDGRANPQGKTVLRTIPASTSASSRDILLAILLSGGPDEAGLNLVFPQGVGLRLSDLVIASFDNLEDFGTWDFTEFFGDGESTWNDLIEPILKSLGRTFVISQDINSGQTAALALAEIGVPTAEPLSVIPGYTFRQITDDIMIRGFTPETKENWIINTSFVFNTNYVGGEPQITTRYKLPQIPSLGRPADEVVFDLKGLVLPTAPGAARIALDSLAATQFLLSTYRKEWVVQVVSNFFVFAPGDTIEVTSEFLRGFSDTLGVEKVVTRCVGATSNYVDGTQTLRLLAYNIKSLPWHYGGLFADVEPITGGSRVTTNSAPVFEYFETSLVGKTLRFFPMNDHAAYEDVTVTGVSGFFTIDVAPALTFTEKKGFYSLPLYGDTFVEGQAFSFLADNDGLVDGDVNGTDLI